jgi:hypothetical protein
LSRWSTIRALLLAAALVVGLIDGCPVPSEKNLQEWPPALVPFGKKLTATREWLMKPFSWIRDGLGVSQRWSLFSAPDEKRFRMWIEARSAQGSWQILFRAHDPLHRYQADLIEYRRLRGAWNIYKRGPNAGYPVFVDWVSRTIFLDPALKFDEVRVRMEPIDVSRRANALLGIGEFQHEERRERAALLGARAR